MLSACIQAANGWQTAAVPTPATMPMPAAPTMPAMPSGAAGAAQAAAAPREPAQAGAATACSSVRSCGGTERGRGCGSSSPPSDYD